MAGFFDRLIRSFNSARSMIPLWLREDISFSFRHLKNHLAERVGFIIFYFFLGGLLTLITQTESLSGFGNKVLDEQIGIRTITLMLAGSAVLACITFLFYRTEEPQNRAFLWCHNVLSRVVDTGADLCLIFICITAIPFLFSSDHPSLLAILLGYVSMLVILGVMTYIPTFTLNTRMSIGSVTYRILSAVVIVIVLVFLYAAASYK